MFRFRTNLHDCQQVGSAVDAASGYKGKPTDAEHVAFLFEPYQRYTSLFPAERSSKRRKKKETPA